jgi:GMP synthase-like glutamine amidotransferase
MSRRVLLLQHMDGDSPGRFGDFLAADGFSVDRVSLHKGEPIPALASYDFMYVLGGPMDVWQVKEYPWLAHEKAVIREWVATRARPFLGICLGHQLLAEALGGKVALADEEEIGVFEISFDHEPPAHVMTAGLPVTAKVTQWHHAEVKLPPPGARVFASSRSAAVQAMAVGDCALGLQFHAEWKSDFIASWNRLPSYAAALEKALGASAHARLIAETTAMMPGYHALARRLYDNLLQMAGTRVTT